MYALRTGQSKFLELVSHSLDIGYIVYINDRNKYKIIIYINKSFYKLSWNSSTS